MRLSLPSLTSEQAVVAIKPEIGAESKVRITAEPFVKLGAVVTNASGTASWKPIAGISLPSGGMDLHLRCDESHQGLDGDPSVTLSVTLVGVVGAATAVAAFGVGSWWADQSKTFPIGTAVDFVGQGSGNSARLISAVSGVSSSANLPPNASFSVYASPAATGLVDIGYKRSVNAPYKSPGAVPIAEGYDSAKVVKKGRNKTADLTIELVHISAQSGLSRYRGCSVPVIVEVVKDKSVHTETIVYTGYNPEPSPARTDGDDEVKETTTGPYEDYLIFTAP